MHTVKLAIARGCPVLGLLLGCIPESQVDDGSSSSSSSSSTSGTGATGTTYVALNADALCNRLITDCQQTALQQDCIAQYHPLKVTAACNTAIGAASCADLTSTTSTVSNTCFPACTAGSTPPVCNGDGTVTICNDAGLLHRNDCELSCQTDGYTHWTGSCGTAYAGQTAAQPQCWCQ
jgi:hypothetical protein